MQNITYRFIQNVGDYFPSGYFTDDFITKVQNCAGRSADDMKALCSPYVQIRGEYEEYKNFIINGRARVEDKIKHTHDWHTTLLKKLGYDTDNPYQEPYVVKDSGEDSPTEIIPVRHILRSGNQVSMLIMEMQNLITVGDTEPDGLFKQQYEDDRSSGQQRYYAGQWRQVIPAEYLDREKYRFSPAIINKAITQIFLMPEERRPHYILMLAGNQVFLFDSDKWARGSYLQFSLDDLYFQGQIKAYRLHYALFHLLCSKEALAADGQTVLMDSLIEESYKNAYEVTKDLKEGVIFAVETLANEALYYWKQHNNIPVSDYTDDTFEAEVKDDCLTIIYRLLFLFYAESREELEILPIGDEVYKLGYSLESLRDLEMMRLNSQASRDGYFFDDSIRHLFGLLANGHHAAESNIANKSFRVRPIDSPLFNNNNLHHLADVRIRNIKWQEIIKALSLSKKKNYCGRISYANLGVNQLGSVYESLLAFRGFYAEEDYIEVHKANEPQDGTFLVPYSRMGDFDISEILTHPETGAPQILPKGTFVYRLNGRDRQKSASYYTPEVLTRSTVKYTLKSIIDDVRDNKRKATELLELKILEPAMGAAAFQNEVINQLAEAYLQHQQRQQREAGLTNWRISPDQYRNELQKVKAYIATHNVYGVDLNPTAVELGKLSLWLNVIHKDMETPFFANRICVGNAVIGAWLKVYSKNEFYGISERYGAKLKPNKWWEKAPHKVKFFANRVNRSVNEVYHFLLPDANMLGVRSIKEQKKEHPAEEKQMAAILKDWTAPIASYDFKTLQRLSAKIDILLKDYFTDQISIEKYTNNRREIWDGIDHSGSESLFKEEEQAESYARKQTLFDTRYGHNNAYRKLKLAMDYWCSLWFWEYKDADNLPTRQEYWADIEALLDVDNEKLDNRTRKALERTDMVSEDIDMEYNRISEDESQIVAKTQEELLTAAHGNTNLFSDEDPLRLKIVCRLSERYRFFHPMLEFIEVFWLRDGFDIICGNPPFLKWLFEPQKVLSDKYPELVIRPDEYDADYVETNKDKYLVNQNTIDLYYSEQTECACCQSLLNNPSLYGELKGGQTDLFKCILLNSTGLLSPMGFMGMIHPDTVFTEAKGQTLREYLYPRLIARYHYNNKLRLFSEVHGEKIFDCCIYRGEPSTIKFDSISNLFHPSTIDASYAHIGNEVCLGLELVDEEGKKHLNTSGHKDRIVHYDEDLLKIVGQVFEDTDVWQSCKLISIHTMSSLNIVRSFMRFNHVSSIDPFVTVGFDATNALKDGTMKQETKFPDYDSYEMIFNSTQVGILSPFSKMPQKVCNRDTHYDGVDYTKLLISDDIRSNYIPKTDIISFKNYIDETGVWFTRYKAGFKKMMDPTHERTLKGGILPPKSSHTHSMISVSFEDAEELIQFVGLSASIMFDFFIKTVGVRNLTSSVINGLPYGINDKYKSSIKARVLRLNCVNHWYKELWEETYDKEISSEEWSSTDKRLSTFKNLSQNYNNNILLKNDFERRQALVELDVIAAMALGFTLDDLIFVYVNTFSTTQKYEADTWYDAKGRVVFSVSGEYDLKIPRKGNRKQGTIGWEDIRGEQIDENTYRGIQPSHTHTIDPKKSELYGGQQMTYYAPYTRCDRIADYRRAWAHFEKIYNK